MIIKKYYSLIIKFLAYLKFDNINFKHTITKGFKFFYTLILLPFEMLGDSVFLYKRFLNSKINNPSKVLIIKVDQMGDVLFSTMLLPLIKEKYPNIKIDYLINKKTEQILIGNPHINNIYYWRSWFLANVPGRGRFSFIPLKENLKIWKKLKQEKYDIIINVRAYIPSSNIFWKFLNPKKLIAFDISQQSFLADNVVEYSLYQEEWQNYLNLLKPLNITNNISEPRAEFYNFSDSGLVYDNLAVISPISFNPERSWSKEKWLEAVDILTKKGYQVVLTGIEIHREYLKEIKGNSNAIIFIDSLPKLADLIKKSKLFLGAESFSAHLAVALDSKTYCLVNTKIFYIKNYSQQKLIDGRSMIPQFFKVNIIDISKNPNDVL